MSPDPQTTSNDASEPAAVLEWGGTPDDGDAAPRRRFGAPGRLAREFLADRRLVPLAASLGAVALFVSLVSEWQVTSVDGTIFGDGDVGRRPVAGGIADLGGWGGGYLAGLFLLVAAAVLLLFGPPAGRRYARLIGLSTGGMLLALLVAVVAALKDNSMSVDEVLTLQLDPGQFEIAYGRGVWCALFGVAATTLAVYLAGLHLAAEPVRPAGTVTVEPAPAAPTVEAVADEASGDWLWRRQPTGRDEDEIPEAPLGLTVSPATPFTSPAADHDKLR